MSDNIAIHVEQLGKRYRLGASVDLKRDFRETIMEWPGRLARRIRGKTNNGIEPKDRTGDFWALRDVHLQIAHGEVVGIIGRNGAGKSTLLKILSRITSPTTGQAIIRGRVGSLLEVGTGFNTELTGRENVYLNGAILGMRKAEIDAKFDEIVAFAETQAFIDTPVKRYSSGMQVRLAFAVAAHLDPEILVIDEVLAVGDVQFRRKCLGKMKNISRGGRTILFVSHNMGQIRQLCSRVIWLDQGRVRMTGPAEEVCRAYQHEGLSEGAFNNPVVRQRFYENDLGGPQIESVEMRDSQTGLLKTAFNHGESFDVILRLKKDGHTTKEYSAVWFIHSEDGQQLAVGWSYPMDNVRFTSADRTLSCRIGPLSLPVGAYRLRFVLHVPYYEMFDDWSEAISFQVTECDPFGTGYEYSGIHAATCFIPHKWKRETTHG